MKTTSEPTRTPDGDFLELPPPVAVSVKLGQEIMWRRVLLWPDGEAECGMCLGEDCKHITAARGWLAQQQTQEATV